VEALVELCCTKRAASVRQNTTPTLSYSFESAFYACSSSNMIYSHALRIFCDLNGVFMIGNLDNHNQ
jgi:hypothetical protein